MRSLRVGEEVLGRDGHRLGAVHRLVVDEQARWGFPNRLGYEPGQ